MSIENIGLFLAKANLDRELYSQIHDLEGSSVEAFVPLLVRLSEQVRLPFTEEELTEAAQFAARGEITQEMANERARVLPCTLAA